MPTETLTDRLILRPVDPADPDMLQGIFAIQSDPATWEHLLEGIERDISQTCSFLEEYATSRQEHRLGWWAITLRKSFGGLEAGAIVGVGGAGIRVPGLRAWNLGYRLTPAAWGFGLATEASRAAIEAANLAQADVPVVARALVRNPASCRVLERVGLSVIWEGPAPKDASLTVGLALRVYSDRHLADDLLQQIQSLG